MKERLNKVRETAGEVGEKIFYFIFGEPQGNCKCKIDTITSGGWSHYPARTHSYYSYVCRRCYKRGRREGDRK